MHFCTTGVAEAGRQLSANFHSRRLVRCWSKSRKWPSKRFFNWQRSWRNYTKDSISNDVLILTYNLDKNRWELHTIWMVIKGNAVQINDGTIELRKRDRYFYWLSQLGHDNFSGCKLWRTCKRTRSVVKLVPPWDFGTWMKIVCLSRRLIWVMNSSDTALKRRYVRYVRECWFDYTNNITFCLHALFWLIL